MHGQKSDAMQLGNMIFQGSVLGPILWNIFYADCGRPVRKHMFIKSVFADDLIAFRPFIRGIGNEYITREMEGLQKTVHAWGAANRVTFDAEKTFNNFAPWTTFR